MAERAVVMTEDEEIMQDLLRLRDVQEREGVNAARILVKELAAKWPDAPAVQHKARVLEPPRVIGTGPPTGHYYVKAREWLKQHAREYPGCWLAVKDDRLVAADPDLEVVMDAVKQEGIEHALLHLQPDPSRWT